MMLALAPNDARIPAEPGASATCPICRDAVRPKCGQVITWHWAHVGREDCDEWAEPDTAWHRYWQAKVPTASCEIIMGRHRADIRAFDGTIVEIQHSTISAEEIQEREAFYGRMAWVFDAREAYAEDRLSLRRKDTYFTFRWKHPRKTLGACRKPVFLDLGDELLLRMRKIHLEAPCGGWGLLTKHSDMAAWMNTGTWSP